MNSTMIWSDTPWFPECDTGWQVGSFYKLRCQYVENQYGTTSSPLHASGLPAAALILAATRGEALLQHYPRNRRTVREVHHRLRKVR